MSRILFLVLPMLLLVSSAFAGDVTITLQYKYDNCDHEVGLKGLIGRGRACRVTANCDKDMVNGIQENTPHVPVKFYCRTTSDSCPSAEECGKDRSITDETLKKFTLLDRGQDWPASSTAPSSSASDSYKGLSNCASDPRPATGTIRGVRVCVEHTVCTRTDDQGGTHTVGKEFDCREDTTTRRCPVHALDCNRDPFQFDSSQVQYDHAPSHCNEEDSSRQGRDDRARGRQ